MLFYLSSHFHSFSHSFRVAEPEDVSLEDQMVETTIADIVTSSGHVMDSADQAVTMEDGTAIHIIPTDDTEEEEVDLPPETMVHLE